MGSAGEAVLCAPPAAQLAHGVRQVLRRRVDLEARHQRGLRRVRRPAARRRGRRERRRLCAASTSAPATGRTGSRRAALSSPTRRQRARARRTRPSACPVASRNASAIGRSNDGPSLRRSAGARFTVRRRDGNSYARVDDRGAHALPALLHRRVGEPDDAERRSGGHHVGLHRARGGPSRPLSASLAIRSRARRLPPRPPAPRPSPQPTPRPARVTAPGRCRAAAGCLEASTATMSNRTSLTPRSAHGRSRQPQCRRAGRPVRRLRAACRDFACAGPRPSAAP